MGRAALADVGHDQDGHAALTGDLRQRHQGAADLVVAVRVQVPPRYDPMGSITTRRHWGSASRAAVSMSQSARVQEVSATTSAPRVVRTTLR